MVLDRFVQVLYLLSCELEKILASEGTEQGVKVSAGGSGEVP